MRDYDINFIRCVCKGVWLVTLGTMKTRSRYTMALAWRSLSDHERYRDDFQ